MRLTLTNGFWAPRWLETAHSSRARTMSKKRGALWPVLKKNASIYQYAPNNWGPEEVQGVSPPGGWHNPPAGQETFAGAGEAI